MVDGVGERQSGEQREVGASKKSNKVCVWRVLMVMEIFRLLTMLLSTLVGTLRPSFARRFHPGGGRGRELRVQGVSLEYFLQLHVNLLSSQDGKFHLKTWHLMNTYQIFGYIL